MDKVWLRLYIVIPGAPPLMPQMTKSLHIYMIYDINYYILMG
jgi:hypothetical protein